MRILFASMKCLIHNNISMRKSERLKVLLQHAAESLINFQKGWLSPGQFVKGNFCQGTLRIELA